MLKIFLQNCQRTTKIQPILNQNKFSNIIPSSTQQLESESFYFNVAKNSEENKPINDKILTINEQVPTIQINPYIFSKEINLAKKTYSISSIKFNSSATNKAQNLNKLTITKTDNKNSNEIIKELLTRSEDFIKTDINKLTNQDYIKVVNYLFYSNNKNLPNIFSYVYNSDTQKCKTLLIICQILKERLKDLKINKHNTLRQTQENFEGYFRDMLVIATMMIQKHIDLLNTPDEKLNDVLTVVTQKIENWEIGPRHDNNNLGIDENTENSQLQRVALNSNKQDRSVEDIVRNILGHNIAINGTPVEGQILTQHVEHNKVLPFLGGVNDEVLAINAFNLMIRTYNLTSRSICAEHLLKLEKNNLLIILSRFYNRK